MSREIRTFEVTTPAGTTLANPLVTDLAMPPRIVDQIDVLVPPGNNGELRFAVAMAGQAVIPNNANEWVVANGETIKWPLVGQPDSGAWQIITWNTGQYDHTVWVTFELSLTVADAQSSAVTPIAADVLSNAPTGA